MDASKGNSLVGWLFDVDKGSGLLTAPPAIARAAFMRAIGPDRPPLEAPFEALFTGPEKAISQWSNANRSSKSAWPSLPSP